MIVRPLTVFERENVRSFYLSLSADDRRRRFCCTLADETISKYVDRLNFTRDAVLGAFDEQAHIIGLAELVRGPKESEMAFSVRPDRRGQKIGTKLLESLIAHAGRCGIRKVFVMFLSDNTPMRKMAIRAGMPVETFDGESHAALELPEPSAVQTGSCVAEEGSFPDRDVRTIDAAQQGSPLNETVASGREPAMALAVNS